VVTIPLKIGKKIKYIRAYKQGAEAFNAAKRTGSARKYEEAAQHFARSHSIFPDSTGPLLNEVVSQIRAEKLKADGDLTTVIPKLEEYVEVSRAPAKKRYKTLSQLYLKDGQIGNTISLLQDARERFPGDSEFRTDLLNAYSRAGQAKKAIAEYRELVKRNSYDAGYRSQYGAVLVEAGRYEEGISQLQRARELGGDNWERDKKNVQGPLRGLFPNRKCRPTKRRSALRRSRKRTHTAIDSREWAGTVPSLFRKASLR
jgi:tetratricopeptide (TPR) repeat protein